MFSSATSSHEIFVGVVMFEGLLDKTPQGLLGIERVQGKRSLGRPNSGIDLFEDREIQAFLASEIVVNHALGGAHERGDRVDTGTAQATIREFLRCDRENVGFRAVGIPRSVALLLGWRLFDNAIVHNSSNFAPSGVPDARLNSSAIGCSLKSWWISRPVGI